MLKAAVEELSLVEPSISYVIVADERMSELHRQFSGIPGTTDVLTFDLRDDPASPLLEAEIYLCVDEARRRATDLGHDTDRELLLYALHGTLHLLGHDDHTAASHRLMHEEEDRILHAIGVGPVFAARPATRAARRPATRKRITNGGRK